MSELAMDKYKSENLDVIKMVTGERWKQNCYIVYDVTYKDIVLIDPGHEEEAIINTINDLKGNLKYVMLTHAHHDHLGAADMICSYYNIPCLLHKGDIRLLHHSPMYAFRFAGRRIKAPKNYETYDNIADPKIGDSAIQIMHSPGHSPGSVCIIINNLIFTGDTLFYKKIGRTDLPGSSDDELNTSISNLLMLNTDKNNGIILPGHGRSWNMPEACTWWKESVVNKLGIERYNAFE